MRNVGETGLCCNEVSLRNDHVNPNNFSNRYTCRCAPQCCTFVIKRRNGYDATDAKTESPTQFCRMWHLVETNPEWLLDIPSLLLVSQMPFPRGDPTPTKEMLLYMSHCPTLYLCCKDVLGWEQVYHQAYQEIMDAKVGTELLNPCKVMVLVDPVVPEGAVPILTKDVVVLALQQEKQIITTMVNEKFQLLIFVIPVILDAAKVELWTRCLNWLQGSVEVILVAAPTRLDDHAIIENFSAQMLSIQRSSGRLDVISPDTQVRSMQNKKLIYIGDSGKSRAYWNAVYEIVKDKGLNWPGFMINPNKESAPTKKSVDLAIPDQGGPSSVGTLSGGAANRQHPRGVKSLPSRRGSERGRHVPARTRGGHRLQNRPY
uniref:Uncharacterized protein n=1 Tax=Caenorhabditis japonica TaxID=281687 RepID=A0A8R1HXY9_CAEJA